MMRMEIARQRHGEIVGLRPTILLTLMPGGRLVFIHGDRRDPDAHANHAPLHAEVRELLLQNARVHQQAVAVEAAMRVLQEAAAKDRRYRAVVKGLTSARPSLNWKALLRGAGFPAAPDRPRHGRRCGAPNALLSRGARRTRLQTLQPLALRTLPETLPQRPPRASLVFVPVALRRLPRSSATSPSSDGLFRFAFASTLPEAPARLALDARDRAPAVTASLSGARLRVAEDFTSRCVPRPALASEKMRRGSTDDHQSPGWPMRRRRESLARLAVEMPVRLKNADGAASSPLIDQGSPCCSARELLKVDARW